MPLQKNNLPVAFNRGIDTKTDPKQVVPGKLLTLQNGIFQTAQEIRKRNGYKSLSQSILNLTGSQSISKSDGLATFKNELNLYDGLSYYTYSAEDPGWFTPQFGGFGNASFIPGQLTVSPITRSLFNTLFVDSAYDPVSGLYAYGWNNNQISIVDSVTGSVVATFNDNTAATKKVLLLSGNFMFLNGTKLSYVSSSNPPPNATGTTPGIGPYPAVATRFDATVINNKIYVAYNDGAGNVKAYFINPDSSASTPVVVDSVNDASSCVTVFGDASNNVWIGYFGNNGGFFKVLDSTLVVTVHAVTAINNDTAVTNITGCVKDPNIGTFLWEHAPGTGFQNEVVILFQYNIQTNTAVHANHTVIAQCGLASKCFIYNGIIYFTAVFNSALQPTYFLVGTRRISLTLNQMYIASKIFQGTSGGFAPSLLPEFNLVGVSKYQTALLQTLQTSAVSTAKGAMSAKFQFEVTAPTAEIANNLHLGGGFLTMYDGINVVEHGFHVFPEITSTSQSNVGGFIAGNFTYQYVVVYEWVDGLGQIHQSAPSIPTSVVVPAGTNTNSVTINYTPCVITTKTVLNASIYRTQGNQTIFYKISSTITQSNNGTYVDTLADASIIGNEQLYTTGGEVENIAPPAVLSMTTYKNRIILVPSDNPQTWWYSKEVIPGVPAEFSDLFVENIDQKGGDIIAVVQLDDKIVFFKASNIFVVTGDGPAPSGANNDFSPSQIIASDTGCINAASVVLMPNGVMYQSSKGIYLLDRSLQVSYVGAEVEGFNSQTITSAKLIPSVNQVRFTLGNGTALVYDYFFGQWSVFTNCAAVNSAIFQNVFTYVQSNGLVLQETPGVYTDSGSFIQLSLTTSWLSLAQLQGFQRIYKLLILGQFKSAHQLQVQLAYDFDPAILQTDLVTTSSTPPYQWRIFPARQKCEAIQFTIQDMQSSGFGEGLSLSAMALELGVKVGLNKLPAASSYG